MTRVLIKRGNLDKDIHIGRTSGEDVGGGQGDAPLTKEHQRWPVNHQKPGQADGTHLPRSLRRNPSW